MTLKFLKTIKAGIIFSTLLSTAATGDTLVVGNEAVARSNDNGDIARAPFVMILGDDVLPCGRIQKWNVHIASILEGRLFGQVGLLVLRPMDTEDRMEFRKPVFE